MLDVKFNDGIGVEVENNDLSKFDETDELLWCFGISLSKSPEYAPRIVEGLWFGEGDLFNGRRIFIVGDGLLYDLCVGEIGGEGVWDDLKSFGDGSIKGRFNSGFLERGECIGDDGWEFELEDELLFVVDTEEDDEESGLEEGEDVFVVVVGVGVEIGVWRFSLGVGGDEVEMFLGEVEGECGISLSKWNWNWNCFFFVFSINSLKVICVFATTFADVNELIIIVDETSDSSKVNFVSSQSGTVILTVSWNDGFFETKE